MKHIAYTRYNDGGVDICTPVRSIFDIMQFGGFWDLMGRGFVEHQIELQVQGGIAPDHAARYARAVAFGGCTESEVYSIIKDRDCARHGHGHTLLDTSDVPFDRWFRGAWRQNNNSGQIYVDLDAARLIHWDRLIIAADETNRRRRRALRPLAPVKVGHMLRRAVLGAPDHETLRKIWPRELSMFAVAHENPTGGVLVTTMVLGREEGEDDRKYVDRCCPALAGKPFIVVDLDDPSALPRHVPRHLWRIDNEAGRIVWVT